VLETDAEYVPGTLPGVSSVVAMAPVKNAVAPVTNVASADAPIAPTTPVTRTDVRNMAALRAQEGLGTNSMFRPFPGIR
jgi:hypothetical protein